MKTLQKILIITFLATVGWGCSKSEKEGRSEQNKKPLPSFRTVKASVGKIDNTLSITGRVVPLQKIDIIAEVQGTSLPIKNSFEEGNTFRKGELLIAIDNKKFVSTLYAQKSKFLSALVRVMSDLKIDYPEQYTTWDRFLSEIDVEKSLPALPKVANDQLRYFLAANGIYDLYYTIQSQEETLKDYHIYAPFSGAVTSAFVDAGDLIRPGVKLGGFIQTGVFEVKASVSVSDLDNLSTGQEIELLNRSTNQTYQGSIHRFGKSIDPNTQAVTVFIRVNGKDLKEGMYLEGALKSKNFENVAEIPKKVLTRENQVYLIANNVVKLKTVSPVQYKDETVLVKGLSNGDLIITDPIQTPLEGTRATSK